jgi:hypothetical protein
MAGASVSALLVAAAPTRAAELEGDHGAGPVICSVEFPPHCLLDELIISDDFSTTGDVVIDGILGIGGEDQPLVVEEDAGQDAFIGGSLIIDPVGQVLAFDADAGLTADAEATAVTIESDDAPRFVNNGLIEAEAEADAIFFADADATGIDHDGEELAEDINTV